MQAFEIRSLTDDDIREKLEDSYEELFNLRFQAAIGQMKDKNQTTQLKRQIARMKTVLRERQLGIGGE